MKKKISFFLFAIFAIWLNNYSYSQQSVQISKSGWKPAKVQNDGSNLLNGVSFFFRKEGLNAEDFILIKLINHNTYPVNVQWQEDGSGLKKVPLQASSEIEGSFNALMQPEKNRESAALVIPKSKISKENTLKQQILSSLEVVEFIR